MEMKFALTILFGLCLLPVLTKAQTQDESRQIGDPRMFDQWGKIPFSDEKARLDNLAIYLQKDEPTFVTYLVFYAGRKSCAGEIQARADRAKNYLVNKRGVQANRVIWKDGGYRKEFTVEIWAWPRDVGEPYASPTLTQNDVQVVKCKPKNLIRSRHIKS
jgi:hypothetical protein